MTDAQYTTLPLWPNAYPASGASATLKRLNEDFIVTELPLQLPSGEGEHIWLDIEKNGANTAFVAQQLAEAAGVSDRDVGYAVHLRAWVAGLAMLIPCRPSQPRRIRSMTT